MLSCWQVKQIDPHLLHYANESRELKLNLKIVMRLLDFCSVTKNLVSWCMCEHFGTGIYLLAKFEAVADRKLYRVNDYIISGHSLEHLCLALIPCLLSVMLIYRERKFQRYNIWFDCCFGSFWKLVNKLSQLFCFKFFLSKHSSWSFKVTRTQHWSSKYRGYQISPSKALEISRHQPLKICHKISLLEIYLSLTKKKRDLFVTKPSLNFGKPL